MRRRSQRPGCQYAGRRILSTARETREISRNQARSRRLVAATVVDGRTITALRRTHFRRKSLGLQGASGGNTLPKLPEGLGRSILTSDGSPRHVLFWKCASSAELSITTSNRPASLGYQAQDGVRPRHTAPSRRRRWDGMSADGALLVRMIPPSHRHRDGRYIKHARGRTDLEGTSELRAMP